MSGNGIHSQGFLCSNLARTSEFLTTALGLRLIKRTVSPHSERLLQSYFGFGQRAGLEGDLHAVASYVEWDPIFYGVPSDGLTDPAAVQRAVTAPVVGDARGRWGVGTTHHLALHVRSRNALLRWKRRLTDSGVIVTGPYDRNYFHAIYFRGPDGELLEIATTDPGFSHDERTLGASHRTAPEHTMVGARTEVAVAEASWPRPVPDIDSEMELAGFHHVTAVASDNDRTAEFFVDAIGLTLIKKTDYMDAEGATHYYFSVGDDPAPGSILTFFGFPEHERGRLGIGLTHHYALSVDDDRLDSWRSQIEQAGVQVGPVQDHVYFRCFHFRDPDGHICAVATRPQFTLDEDAGALGTSFCLPPWFEERRDEIERTVVLKPAPAAAQAPAPEASVEEVVASLGAPKGAW